MKTKLLTLTLGASAFMLAASCSETNNGNEANAPGNANAEIQTAGGQENVSDDVSQPNVVKIAVGSKDHTTLVKALQAADLVTSLSNNGPFTVFAPVNSAFDALPAGTLDNLLKPESKDALANILQHHVAVAVFNTESLQDGQVLGMVDGTNATIHIKDGKYMIDEANIVASVPASNGIVHVIDKVLLPPSQ
ncbi:MAG: fasciclin domain-containing protein [Bacteroidia bacterium]